MALKKRKLENWISGLREYVEDTEAPREFWFWGALFTIAATLQRRVWLPYGLENIYPNIYVLIVAPPGERKAGPPTLAKKMLMDSYVPVAVDSSSKRSLTKELAKSAETEQFMHPDGKPRRMSTLAIISKELSSLMAVDPKAMVEILTELYDAHDEWKYKTSGEGYDFLYNVCVSCFLVTTPKWLASNLPGDAVGGGWSSRHVIIPPSARYKDVPWPSQPDDKLYRKLLFDLNEIHKLVGEFKIEPAARKFFDDWYAETGKKRTGIKDERLVGFLNRMHVTALKTAMSIRVAYSNDLTIVLKDIDLATQLMDKTLVTAGDAFGGYGESKLGAHITRIEKQIKMLGEVNYSELLAMNFHNLSKNDFDEVLTTLEIMKKASRIVGPSKKEMIVKWKR